MPPDSTLRVNQRPYSACLSPSNPVRPHCASGRVPQPGFLRGALPPQAPEQPESFEAVMSDVRDKLMPGVVHWQVPYHPVCVRARVCVCVCVCVPCV